MLVRQSIGLYLSDYAVIYIPMFTRPRQDANDLFFVSRPWCNAIRVRTPPEFTICKGLFTWRRRTPGWWGNPPSRGRKIKRVYMHSYNPGVLGWGFLRFFFALAIKKFEERRPKLISWKRRKINSRTHVYLFMKASRVVLRGVWFREEPLT